MGYGAERGINSDYENNRVNEIFYKLGPFNYAATRPMDFRRDVEDREM